MKKHLLFLLFLAILPALPRSEDWQCARRDGCQASISVDGELQTLWFRRGDIISDDDGWVVHPDDGWVKVRSNHLFPVLHVNAWISPWIKGGQAGMGMSGLQRGNYSWWCDPDGPYGYMQPVYIEVFNATPSEAISYMRMFPPTPFAP